MISEVLDLFAKLGRAGGALLVLIGCGLAGFGAWGVLQFGPWNGAPIWSETGVGFSLASLGVGVVAFFRGVGLLVKGGPPRVRLSDDALRALLSEARPHVICLDCRAPITVAPCEHCRQSSSCFEARTEAERETARVLLGLEPG